MLFSFSVVILSLAFFAIATVADTQWGRDFWYTSGVGESYRDHLATYPVLPAAVTQAEVDKVLVLGTTATTEAGILAEQYMHELLAMQDSGTC